MTSQILAAYLINAAWQAPLVALAATLVSKLGGLSPRRRHWAWLGFLALAIAAPAFAIDWTAAAPPAPVTMAAPATPSGHSDPVASLFRLVVIAMDPGVATALGLAFSAAAAAALARLALANAGAGRLARRARTITLDPDLAEAIAAFASVHRCRIPAVRQSARVLSPVVVGALSPVILVPERFAELESEDQRAALLHEMAHVARGDYGVNIVCEAAALPLSWHPAIYQLKAGVRRTRELACDAMASAAIGSEELYARRLLSLARALGTPAAGDPAAAMVGLFGRSDLEDRLMHLMRPKPSRLPGLRAARLGAAITLAALALAPAAFFHISPAVAASRETRLEPPAPSAAPAMPAKPVAPIDDAEAAARASSQAADDAAPKAPHRRHRAPAPPMLDKPIQTMAAIPAPPAVVAQPASPALVAMPPLPPIPPLPAVSVKISADASDIARLTADAARRYADEQKHWQAQLRCALEQAAEAQRLAATAAVKQQVADLAARETQLAALNRDRLEKQMDAARAALNDARVKESLAQAQARIASEVARRSQVEADRVRRQIERALREARRADEGGGDRTEL